MCKHICFILMCTANHMLSELLASPSISLHKYVLGLLFDIFKGPKINKNSCLAKGNFSSKNFDKTV